MSQDGVQQENNVALSPDEPPEERIALEEPAGVLFFKREQLTSGGPDKGQAVLDTPDLKRNVSFIMLKLFN